MKKNTLCKVSNRNDSGLLFKKEAVFGFWLLTGLIACQEANAQFVNEGEMVVMKGTLLSVHHNYDNKDTGSFTNDGEVHIFKNWNNDGIVDYTDKSTGKTFFVGAELQNMKGQSLSDFQNVVFNNISSAVPFKLATTFSVGNQADFSKGIVDGDTSNGLVIFKEDADHVHTSDLSFVDGQVQKDGVKAFEFPVGDEKYFRPSYHAVGSGKGGVYTTQYFKKNSNTLHSHDMKEVSIISINKNEYWEIRQDQGGDKIVLSLSMDSRTTPAEFFNPSDEYMVVITRWDSSSGQWINERGVTSDALAGKPYEKLLTSTVSGYGLFTMALVKKTDTTPEELIVYNAISPNDDGLNDSFVIKGIDQFPDNEVEIYNRWGVKVYDAKSYNESDNMFKGYSDGRATIKRGDKLPTGTYFYILKYNTGKEVKEKTGYLYINNQ